MTRQQHSPNWRTAGDVERHEVGERFVFVDEVVPNIGGSSVLIVTTATAHVETLLVRYLPMSECMLHRRR